LVKYYFIINIFNLLASIKDKGNVLNAGEIYI